MANLDSLINDQLIRGLTKAGFYLVSKLRQNLNVAQPYKKFTGKSGVYFRGYAPSKPGQFPKKLSGALTKSIASSVSGLTLTVGSAIPYAKFLQLGTSKMAPRPFLSMTFNKEKDALGKIILNG